MESRRNRSILRAVLLSLPSYGVAILVCRRINIRNGDRRRTVEMKFSNGAVELTRVMPEGRYSIFNPFFFYHLSS